MKSIKCKLGLHKWSKNTTHFNFDSNVKDYEKQCLTCGEIKKWNVPVDE